MFEHNSDLDDDGLPPSGTREAVAVRKNNKGKRRETIMFQYKYDNRELSTTLSYPLLDEMRADTTTSKYGSIEMLDKLVEYYCVKRGFIVEHSRVQVY